MTTFDAVVISPFERKSKQGKSFLKLNE